MSGLKPGRHLKPGAASMRIADRHGRKGDVPLAASIPPGLKDDLVTYCLQRNVTQRDTVEAALRLWLSLADTDLRRWYGG